VEPPPLAKAGSATDLDLRLSSGETQLDDVRSTSIFRDGSELSPRGDSERSSGYGRSMRFMFLREVNFQPCVVCESLLCLCVYEASSIPSSPCRSDLVLL
jgi:hypothetical protein